MSLVLGVDAGGTKTVCLLADEDGQIVAEARGGGANLQTGGELIVE
jgi:N-acetylglucosamine kinase